MRVLVLGAGGMLGHKVSQRLSADFEVTAVFRKDPGIYRDFDSVFGRCRLIGGPDFMDEAKTTSLMRDFRPDAVVNCAGVINKGRASMDRYLCIGINSYLPHRLDRLCAEIGARLIHVSTDCVFTGDRGGYAETDPSDALDLYGQTKWLGELHQPVGSAITLRTSMIGRELPPTCNGLLEWFMSQRNRRIKGFRKAIYSGLTTGELAKVIAMTLGRSDIAPGLYQVGAEAISKYDLLRLASKILDVPVEIDPDDSVACDRSFLTGRFADITGYRAAPWPVLLTDILNDETPYDRYRQTSP